MSISKGTHILGIDYGKKFTGFATYKVQLDPYPLRWGRVSYSSDDQLIRDIKQIIEDEFIDQIVIGIPYFTDGSESKATKEVKSFAQELQSKISIPLFCQDEALTTYEAQERMKQDPNFNFKVDLKQIDALSAAIIIEEYLNSKGVK